VTPVQPGIRAAVDGGRHRIFQRMLAKRGKQIRLRPFHYIGRNDGRLTMTLKPSSPDTTQLWVVCPNFSAGDLAVIKEPLLFPSKGGAQAWLDEPSIFVNEWCHRLSAGDWVVKEPSPPPLKNGAQARLDEHSIFVDERFHRSRSWRQWNQRHDTSTASSRTGIYTFRPPSRSRWSASVRAGIFCSVRGRSAAPSAKRWCGPRGEPVP
jgi:hypothetical protein